jgi:membrane dipeptidase
MHDTRARIGDDLLAQAVELHRRALVIDTHNDSIVTHIRRGDISFADPTQPAAGRAGLIAWLRGPLDLSRSTPEVQQNFPKMRQGGLDCGFFHVDVSRAWKNHLAYALDGHGWFDAEVEAHADAIRVVRTSQDVLDAKRDGKLAAVLAIENSDACERSLNVLRMLHRLGIRSMGLTHNLRSDVADGNYESRSGSGLTRFGVEMVKEMNRLGMIVDVAHISVRGFYDVLETSTKPPLASHTCCRALCEHTRNLTDQQIRDLAHHGGSIGVTFVPSFVHPTEPNVDRLVEHIDHIVQLVGPDFAALGSDFDGGGDLLKDATELPQITARLLGRGYREEDLEKILGLNHLRVIRDNLG